jgi:methylase of polypeptide subunit release factors
MLRSGSGCVTAVLARTLRDALGPDHCTLFFSTDINSRAVRATQATGSANSVSFHNVDWNLPRMPSFYLRSRPSLLRLLLHLPK